MSINCFFEATNMIILASSLLQNISENRLIETIKEDSRLLTDKILAPINTFINFLSCISLKKIHTGSQALPFNRICSKNQFFDKRCNDLKICRKNMVTIKSWWDNKSWRKYRSTELLYFQREEVYKNNLVFNITYYYLLLPILEIIENFYENSYFNTG